MSSETINGPWTVVDITDTPKVETHPVDARQDLIWTLKAWAARHDLVPGVITLDDDEDDGLSVTLDALTLDREGDIVTKTREYVVTAQYTVEVQVEVEASSEHEARREAEDLLGGIELEPSWGEGRVTDTQFDSIIDVDWN